MQTEAKLDLKAVFPEIKKENVGVFETRWAVRGCGRVYYISSGFVELWAWSAPDTEENWNAARQALGGNAAAVDHFEGHGRRSACLISFLEDQAARFSEGRPAL